MNHITTLAVKTLRTLGIAVVMFVLISASAVYADTNGGHDLGVSDMLERITTTQGVSGERDIACEDVSDENLELLGDALMQRMIGNEDLHTQMDNMIGGEGSESLTAMHEHLARTYLGCSDSGFGMGMMMGGGMMQHMMGSDATWPNFTNNNSYSSMMGFNTMGLGFGWLGGIIMIAFWVLVIVGIVLLIQKMTSRDDTRQYGRRNEKTPLDILKERYARGEVDKKEFEEKKKDLV